MDKYIKLNFIDSLQEGLSKNFDLIQVVVGPRQVGKTTGILKLLSTLKPDRFHYVSADGLIPHPEEWIYEQWSLTQFKNPSGILVIDEIQKIENWSETVKKLWDMQKKETTQIKLILLGSSSLSIQKGLSESLTGRFQIHHVYHWNLQESKKAYGLDLEQFLVYGGYPGSYRFLNNSIQWLQYIKESIVDTVIGKDILSLAQVKSPALFRQSFDLANSYGGQEISYNKLLGQLQSKGNVELIKHYLELFEGAFLIKQLYKFSNKKVLSRSSSPKILPLCPSLYSLNFDAELNTTQRGRAFGIAVGAELVRLPGKVFYWREGDYEIDFIYQFGQKLFAIEVKSGKKKHSKSLKKFVEKFPKAKVIVITSENFFGFTKLLN